MRATRSPKDSLKCLFTINSGFMSTLVKIAEDHHVPNTGLGMLAAVSDRLVVLERALRAVRDGAVPIRNREAYMILVLKSGTP